MVLLRGAAVLNPLITHDPLVSAIRTGCDAAGFDLVHPFSTRWYNDAVDADLRLPDFGRDDALAVLVANTRALWPAFQLALQIDPGWADRHNPLDEYAEARIGAVAEMCFSSSGSHKDKTRPLRRLSYDESRCL